MKTLLTPNVIGYVIGAALLAGMGLTGLAAPDEPAPVIEVEVAPVEAVTPAPVEPVEPVTCEEGYAMAEDGSCVNSEFWGTEASSIGPFYALEPCESEDGEGQVACYWDASIRGDGNGTDFIMLEGVFYYPEG